MDLSLGKNSPMVPISGNCLGGSQSGISKSMVDAAVRLMPSDAALSEQTKQDFQLGSLVLNVLTNQVLSFVQRVAAIEHARPLLAHGILEASSDHTIDHDQRRNMSTLPCKESTVVVTACRLLLFKRRIPV